MVDIDISKYDELYIDSIDEFIYKVKACGCPFASEFRNSYIRDFGFAALTKEFADEIAERFKGKRVLGVMSGTGYFERALYDRGIEVKASDDGSWKKADKAEYFPIEKLDAVDAVKKYMDWADVVIMSWPPYLDPVAARVAAECHYYGITLFYIGEDRDGCTANDDFFDLIYRFAAERIGFETFFNFSGLHDVPLLIDWIKIEEDGNIQFE